jgi:hypothetical protein
MIVFSFRVQEYPIILKKSFLPKGIADEDSAVPGTKRSASDTAGDATATFGSVESLA